MIAEILPPGGRATDERRLLVCPECHQVQEVFMHWHFPVSGQGTVTFFHCKYCTIGSPEHEWKTAQTSSANPCSH